MSLRSVQSTLPNVIQQNENSKKLLLIVCIQSVQSATIRPQECIFLATQASLHVRYAMEGIRTTRSSQLHGFTELLIGNLVIFVLFSKFCVFFVL